MSFHVVAWVLRESEAKLGQRLTLIALAEHAHDDGTYAWPSVATLASKTRLSERAVQYALKALEDGGAIVQMGVSKSGTRVWRVVMTEAGANLAGVQSTTEGGADSSAGGEAVAPEPSGTVQEPPTRPADGDVPDQRPLHEQLGMRVPTMVDRRRVRPDEGDNAVVLLQHFNNKTGASYRAKDFIEKIIRRMREHPEVGLRQHMEVIEKVLGGKVWWSGRPDPRIIYGSAGQFEKCLNDDGSGNGSRRARGADTLDLAQRLKAGEFGE